METATLEAPSEARESATEAPVVRKWTSQAGPIQTKKVVEVIKSYSWLHQTFTELRGVIGRPELEDRSTYQSLFGSAVREDVRAGQIALGDKRITAEKADADQAIYEARDAKQREEQAAVDAIRAKVKAIMPSWAGAIIIAQEVQDECESQSDYFASSNKSTVVIGFRSGSKEDFRQLRAAAGRFGPTKDLATGPKEYEHRENYSMGAGNYLKDGGRYTSGWRVKSTTLSGLYGNVTIDEEAVKGAGTGVPTAGSVQSGVTGVTVSLNAALGGVEIRFPSKPDQEVLARLKGKGFRWSMRSKCWYKRQSPEAIAFANTLATAEANGVKLTGETATVETPDPFDMAVEDRMAEAAGVACEERGLFGD